MDGRETRHVRQTSSPEDGSSGQALPLCQVPQTQPEAGLHTGPVVLPELPQGDGAAHVMRILFLHGWQSVPGGVKPTYLKDHAHEVLNPKLPDDDFAEAVRIAQAEFDSHRPQAVVGSSRGGAVAMNIDSGDARLVLLCPAWKKYGTAKSAKSDIVILHSRADDVVPFADSEELARTCGATLIEVGNDHRLADPESLATMLEACLMDDEDVATDEDETGILERDWTGLCYTATLQWITTAEDRDWVVAHGTVLSERVGKRIGHAWCERGEWVVDLAMPVGTRIIERDRYYRVVKPEVGKVYSSEDALILSIKTGHQGPWGESEQTKE